MTESKLHDERRLQATVTLLVALLGPAGAPGLPLVATEEPQEPLARLKQVEAEVDDLARRHDGSATPENLAVAARLREVMNGIAALAAAGKEGSPAAWDLLERTAARRERNAAMEAVLALLHLKSDDALRLVFKVCPAMDQAVRRQALSYLVNQERDVRAAAAEALAALKAERDPEALACLAVLAGWLGSLPAARALLGACPSLPPRRAGEPREKPREKPREEQSAAPADDSSEAPPDPQAEAREALLLALAGIEEPEVERWLSSQAFEEARRQPGGGEPQLWLLLRVAKARMLGAARPHLELLIGHQEELIAEEALAALAACSLSEARGVFERILERRDAPARLAARAAVLLGGLEPEAGERALLELARSERWDARREAALALAKFPERDASFLRVLKLLVDPNREVRAAAFQALKRFRRREAIEAVLPLLEPLRARDKALVEEYLKWAAGPETAKTLPRDPAAWGRWWDGAKESFQFPKE